MPLRKLLYKTKENTFRLFILDVFKVPIEKDSTGEQFDYSIIEFSGLLPLKFFYSLSLQFCIITCR